MNASSPLFQHFLNWAHYFPPDMCSSFYVSCLHWYITFPLITKTRQLRIITGYLLSCLQLHLMVRFYSENFFMPHSPHSHCPRLCHLFPVAIIFWLAFLSPLFSILPLDLSFVNVNVITLLPKYKKIKN